MKLVPSQRMEVMFDPILRRYTPYVRWQASALDTTQDLVGQIMLQTPEGRKRDWEALTAFCKSRAPGLFK